MYTQPSATTGVEWITPPSGVLRPPGDAELGDVARVDRLLLELLAVAVEGAAVERPLAAGGVGRCAAGKRRGCSGSGRAGASGSGVPASGDGAGRGPRPSPAGAAHPASNRRPRRLSRSETIRPLPRWRLTVFRRAMRSGRLARRPLRAAIVLRTMALSLTRVARRATTRTRSLLVRSAFAWVPVLRRDRKPRVAGRLAGARLRGGRADEPQRDRRRGQQRQLPQGDHS